MTQDHYREAVTALTKAEVLLSENEFLALAATVHATLALTAPSFDVEDAEAQGADAVAKTVEGARKTLAAKSTLSGRHGTEFQAGMAEAVRLARNVAALKRGALDPKS